MNRNRYAGRLAGLLAVFVFSGCELDAVHWQPDPESVSVVEIKSAAVSGSTISFVVRCAVSDPCWEFYRTEYTRSGNIFSVTVFAQRTFPEPCTQVASTIDASFAVTVGSPGIYTFRFWSHDGRTVEKTVAF